MKASGSAAILIVVFAIVCYASIGAGFHWILKEDQFDVYSTYSWFLIFGWPAIAFILMFLLALIIGIGVWLYTLIFENNDKFSLSFLKVEVEDAVRKGTYTPTTPPPYRGYGNYTPSTAQLDPEDGPPPAPLKK